ncbi:hypothetical protein D3C86_2160340 [compost metagenome]
MKPIWRIPARSAVSACTAASATVRSFLVSMKIKLNVVMAFGFQLGKEAFSRSA